MRREVSGSSAPPSSNHVATNLCRQHSALPGHWISRARRAPCFKMQMPPSGRGADGPRQQFIWVTEMLVYCQFSVGCQGVWYVFTTHPTEVMVPCGSFSLGMKASDHGAVCGPCARHQDRGVWIGGSRGPPWRYALLASAPTIYTLK